MVDVSVLITIGSVLVGFVMFVAAASGVRGQWSRPLVIALFVLGVVFLSVIPLSVALTAGV